MDRPVGPLVGEVNDVSNMFEKAMKEMPEKNRE